MSEQTRELGRSRVFREAGYRPAAAVSPGTDLTPPLRPLPSPGSCHSHLSGSAPSQTGGASHGLVQAQCTPDLAGCYPGAWGIPAPGIFKVLDPLLSQFHTRVNQWLSVLSAQLKPSGELSKPHPPKHGMTPDGPELSFWGDGNVLKLDCGNGCQML